ncbi:uncharacterized protein TNCT_726511 [Trichonephila clavata]|uniref:Chitin-binding type-2 domain-containing protein n=1 Tax=Trichonephila clavata TaxID=2740835 RepID=A0A8X6FLV1_TRICU|nr:uncharacterized protein TNCT_726511 [Trichonephila clavata]
MSKYRTMTLRISFVVFALVIGTNGSMERTKRQAPNINVHEIPKTSFTCDDKKVGEYYADPESHCQVYHVCIPGMNNKLSLISFVCPNGTIFSQATRVCTPYDRVDCSLTKFYENVNGLPEVGNRNSEADAEYDNYVPPPRQPTQAPRQPSSSRNRNTPAPPPPASVPAQPVRNTRFRSGSSQFRGQPATTQTPVRTTPTQAPVAPVRPAFRAPVLAARPPQSIAIANALPARPTVRSVVSTSTASYNYEYEYEYDYEDETPNAESHARSKREAVENDSLNLDVEGDMQETSFICEGKVPGGAYADIESDCETFHICVLLGKYRILDYKVRCANGTAFDQETGSCREKGEFSCENAQSFFQFEKPNQPKSSKKPVISKKKLIKSNKMTSSDKE